MDLIVDVKTDIAKGLAQLSALEPRQFPFVVATAMNNTMKALQVVVRADMAKSFAKPKPFTLNSTRIIFANKQKLEAGLTFKDGSAGGGRSAGKYLQPVIKGGTRIPKAFENAILAAVGLAGEFYAVPARGIALDPFGNIPRASLARIITSLRAGGRNDKGKQFFVIHGDGDNARGLPLGVYQRTGRSIRMIIAFVRAPKYRKQFDFFGIAESNARILLPPAIHLAAKRAMDTSRR